MEWAIPSAAAIIAGATLVLGGMNLRRRDLEYLNNRLARVEEKLTDCERGREELRRENLTLLQRLVHIEQKIGDRP